MVLCQDIYQIFNKIKRMLDKSSFHVNRKSSLICILGLLMVCTTSTQSASAAALELQVVDVENKPIYDLVLEMSPEGSDIVLTTSTNQDGVCVFRNLETKTHKLVLQSFQQDYSYYETFIDITEGTNLYNLTVWKRAGLNIMIEYADGEPANDVRVVLQGTSDAYNKWSIIGQRADSSGEVSYPIGVPEDQYTVIITTLNGKEISRYTENIFSDNTNQFRYTVQEISEIPSFPLLSVVGGLIAITGYFAGELTERARADYFC